MSTLKSKIACAVSIVCQRTYELYQICISNPKKSIKESIISQPFKHSTVLYKFYQLSILFKYALAQIFCII